MGYGISQTGTFDEDVLLRVRGNCPCGTPLNRDNVIYEPAGTVSLARLAELAVLGSDLARCLCGAYEGRTGDAHACYRLPGGPYITATSRIEQRPRNISIAVRHRLPDSDNDRDIAYELPAAELAAAHRLGQPASVRAAWGEALFTLMLGADTSEFPCGAGLRCQATTRPERAAQLDLAVLELPDVSPSSWLSGPNADAIANGDVHCLIHIDADMVHREVDAEARRTGLIPNSGARRELLVNLDGGHFATSVDIDQMLAHAVASGRLLRLQAGYTLQQASSRLRALDEHASELISRLRPMSVKTVDEPPTLVLGFPGTSLEIDISNYAQAPAADQTAMLAHWERQAA